VIAGTATSVSGRVARAQQQKFARQAAQRQATERNSAPAANGSGRDDLGRDDLVGDLQRLADLKSAGALTTQEYAAAKARLLAR
jgi:hypothetical protein